MCIQHLLAATQLVSLALEFDDPVRRESPPVPRHCRASKLGIHSCPALEAARECTRPRALVSLALPRPGRRLMSIVWTQRHGGRLLGRGKCAARPGSADTPTHLSAAPEHTLLTASTVFVSPALRLRSICVRTLGIYGCPLFDVARDRLTEQITRQPRARMSRSPDAVPYCRNGKGSVETRLSEAGHLLHVTEDYCWDTVIVCLALEAQIQPAYSRYARRRCRQSWRFCAFSVIPNGAKRNPVPPISWGCCCNTGAWHETSRKWDTLRAPRRRRRVA